MIGVFVCCAHKKVKYNDVLEMEQNLKKGDRKSVSTTMATTTNTTPTLISIDIKCFILFRFIYFFFQIIIFSHNFSPFVKRKLLLL